MPCWKEPVLLSTHTPAIVFIWVRESKLCVFEFPSVLVAVIQKYARFGKYEPFWEHFKTLKVEKNLKVMEKMLKIAANAERHNDYVEILTKYCKLAFQQNKMINENIYACFSVLNVPTGDHRAALRMLVHSGVYFFFWTKKIANLRKNILSCICGN